MASLLPNKKFRLLLKEWSSKVNGNLDLDNDAGTCELKHDGDLILVAIQKGSGGAWITRFIDTQSVMWSDTTISVRTSNEILKDQEEE